MESCDVPLTRGQKYALAGAGGLGALLLLVLAFRGRKQIAGAVSAGAGRVVSAVSGALTAAQEALLARIEALPVSAAGIQYSLLPPAPFPEAGPFGTDRSFDSLSGAFRPKAEALLGELQVIFSPLGIRVAVAETRRGRARQVFLYGIGRLYQAPGRVGVVTKTLDSNHKDGDAVDYFYLRGKTALGAEEIDKILRPHAARLEKKYGVKWGGNFPGCFKKGGFCDVPHWENA